MARVQVARMPRRNEDAIVDMQAPTGPALRPTWFMAEQANDVEPLPVRVMRPTLPLAHLMELDRALDTPRQRARMAIAQARRRKSTARVVRWTILPGLVIGIWMATIYDIAHEGSIGTSAVALISGEAGHKGDSRITIISKSHPLGDLTAAAASGETGTPIPLMFATSGLMPGDIAAIKLMGLPESFRLTKGMRISEGGWLLRPGEEQGVQLVAPVVPPEPLIITVAAVEPVSGALKSPMREMQLNIEPANAPPDQGKITKRLGASNGQGTGVVLPEQLSLP